MAGKARMRYIARVTNLRLDRDNGHYRGQTDNVWSVSTVMSISPTPSDLSLVATFARVVRDEKRVASSYQ